MSVARWWIPAGVLLGFLIAAIRTGLLLGGSYEPSGVGGSLVAGVAICWIIDASTRRIRPRLARVPHRQQRLALVIGAFAILGLLAGTWHFVSRSYLAPWTEVDWNYDGPVPLAQWQREWCANQAPLQGVVCRQASDGSYVIDHPGGFVMPLDLRDLRFGVVIGAGGYAALVLFVLSVRVLAPHTDQR